MELTIFSSLDSCLVVVSLELILVAIAGSGVEGQRGVSTQSSRSLRERIEAREEREEREDRE